MILSLYKKWRYAVVFILGFLFMNREPAHAAGTTEPSIFSNPVAVGLLSLMILLMAIIGLLGNILIGSAQIKVKKAKKKSIGEKVPAVAASFFLMLLTNVGFAQVENGTEPVKAVAASVAGMSPFAFYIMISVIFLELLVVLVLLLNIRVLLKNEKEKLKEEAELQVFKRKSFSWWARINRFKPVEQEADIDLGHDYDGIRELDNRLPPWWLYGFYLTIIAAGIYLWRFHVSHTGPSSIQEYEAAVITADIKVKEYLKKKGESVDENTVTMMTSPDDLMAGKAIYSKSCIACHKETGAGDVGPNLTDNYWMHGGDIKSVFKTIRYGINAMPQWQNSYSNKEIAQVASYIKSLKGTDPPNAKSPQGELYQEEGIPDKADSTSIKKIISADQNK